MGTHLSIPKFLPSLPHPSPTPPYDKKQDPGDERCHTVDQRDYRGEVAVTKSGIACQAWDQQVPHKHSVNAHYFPDAGLEKNYCRNPNREKRAWCFTTKGHKTWEYCDIPCGQKSSGLARFVEYSQAKFADMRREYPQGMSAWVKKRIGGEVDQDFLGLNTCAIRMSRVLNYVGLRISRSSEYYTIKGGDGMYYMPRVKDMDKWLRKNVGAPTVHAGANSMAKFKGKKGIILFVIDVFTDGATGHVDLWDGKEMIEWRHRNDFTKLPRAEWYFQHARSASLWEFQ